MKMSLNFNGLPDEVSVTLFSCWLVDFLFGVVMILLWFLRVLCLVAVTLVSVPIDLMIFGFLALADMSISGLKRII